MRGMNQSRFEVPTLTETVRQFRVFGNYFLEALADRERWTGFAIRIVRDRFKHSMFQKETPMNRHSFEKFREISVIVLCP